MENFPICRILIFRIILHFRFSLRGMPKNIIHWFRTIYLRGYRYNLHLRPKALLVECGAQTNTVEEEMNAMQPLADILNKVLTGHETLAHAGNLVLYRALARDKITLKLK